MGKPNCSFAKYADQFVNSGEPIETAPNAKDVDESCRDKQIVGVRAGVRITQSASRAAEIRADVAAARAAKVPVVEAGREGTSSMPSTRRGGSFRPPSSGDTSKKRAFRESSVVEPFVAPEGLDLGPEGADYRFAYNYPNKSVAFTLDNVSCADLASKIPGGFTKFPSADSLSEASLYMSWAQESFKSIGAGNRIVDAYERKLKKAEKAESEAWASFAKERKNSDLYRKDLDKSALELKSLKDKYDSETARLRASRDSCVKVEQEKAEGYKALVDRLRMRILSEEAVKKDFRLLVQITGTRECLEGLRQSGVAIPEAKMEQLVADEAKWRDIVDKFEIFDLLDGDLAEPAADGDDRVPADQ